VDAQQKKAGVMEVQGLSNPGLKQFLPMIFEQPFQQESVPAGPMHPYMPSIQGHGKTHPVS
jgi:hypothetical protein